MVSLSYKFAAIKPIRWSISNPRVPVQLHLCSPMSSYFGECFSHCWKFTFFYLQAWFVSLGRREVNKKFPQGHILSLPHLCFLKYNRLSEFLLGRYRKYFESVLSVDNNCCRFLTWFLWLMMMMMMMMMIQDRYLDFHEQGEMRMKLLCWIVGEDAEELVNSA